MSPLKATWRRFIAIVISGIFIAITGTVVLAPGGAFSQVAQPMTGWLWTDTTGWVSLNCSDLGTCATVSYSVSVDATGNLNGYGWSDNVGWIKFGGLSNFPSSGAGTTAANAKLQNNALTGWMRACAGSVKSGDPYLSQMDYPAHIPTLIGDCSTMTNRPDGWDGWISLNGLSVPGNFPYQVRHGSGNNFTGCMENGVPTQSCAWGSDVNGWVDFTYAEYQCTPQQSYCDADGVTLHVYDQASCGFIDQTCAWQCSVDACLSPMPNCDDIKAEPSLVAPGGTTTITWTATNVGQLGCTVTGNGNTWPDDASGSGVVEGSGITNPVNGQTVYTIECTGPDDLTTNSCTTSISPSPAFREI